MQPKKSILKKVASSELPNSGVTFQVKSEVKPRPPKLVLTRTNSADIKHTPKTPPKSPFTRDRSSFRKNLAKDLKATILRTPKPILKRPKIQFNSTLQYETRPDSNDKSLLLTTYRDIDERIEKRISRKRSRYHNPYKDFDAVEHERKEKRFFGTMGYFFTFLVVFSIIIVFVSERMKMDSITENQRNIVIPPVALEPQNFNFDIEEFFIANDSISKDTIAKKITELRRQILRTKYN